MVRLTPGPPGNANPEPHEAQVGDTVSIGPHGELNSQIPSTASMNVLQIETIGHGVNLHDLVVLSCCLEDGL